MGCGFWRVRARPAGDGAGTFRAPAGSRTVDEHTLADGRYRSASRRRTRPSRWPLGSMTVQPPGLPVAGGPARFPATGLGSALVLIQRGFAPAGEVLLSQCLSANFCRLDMLWPGCPFPHPFRAGVTVTPARKLTTCRRRGIRKPATSVLAEGGNSVARGRGVGMKWDGDFG